MKQAVYFDYDSDAANGGRPSVYPNTLTELKDHLKIADLVDTSEDAVLTKYLQAAQYAIEQHCRITLITAHRVMTFDQFEDVIALPRPPLQSVTSVKYLDADGTQQTLADSVYDVSTIRKPGEISRGFGQSWPSVRNQRNAIEVRWKAGFGDAAADVPDDLRHAHLLLCGHWYENRENVVTGTIVAKLPWAVDALVAPYRFARAL